jgi:hypothetical protein
VFQVTWTTSGFLINGGPKLQGLGSSQQIAVTEKQSLKTGKQ